MPEWRPGVLAGLLGEIEVTGRADLTRGLLLIAAAVEAETKNALGQSSHAAGTPSPAGKGGPPSLVSGTLRRSIGHQEMLDAFSPQVRVGTVANVYPPTRARKTSRKTHGRGGATPSSMYGLYQETLGRFDHPFLVPSFNKVVGESAVSMWLQAFATWPRL
jgi:hypothetical protein